MTEVAHLEAALVRVESDLVRARSLVGDAMKKLFETFARLREHLAEERERYESAIFAISGTSLDAGLVGVLREVLGKFVEDIVRLSQSSVRILMEIDQLRGHADAVATRGHRIEKIASTTRVISLNARIEAHRVGEHGKVFGVVADEIKTLAHETTELSKAIRSAISAQAGSLDVASRAASDLAATDLDVTLASHKQLETTIEQLNLVSTSSTQALERIQKDIDSAIESLQFEDMLDQLLGAITRKVAAIRGVCAGEQSIDALTTEVERDAVTQQNVDVGTVELF
ncbi:MAG: methyl-accepting chemotaxis protein [Kofleriaceae bacterium]